MSERPPQSQTYPGHTGAMTPGPRDETRDCTGRSLVPAGGEIHPG